MKKFVIFTFLVIIFTLLFLTFIYLNRLSKPLTKAQKEAAIAKILGRKPNLDDTKPKGDLTYNGKYVSFIYPARVTIEKQLLNGQEAPYDGLERFIFKDEDLKVRVYVEIINTPSNITNLSDYPAVKSRQIQAGSYTQDYVYAGDIAGLVFTTSSNLNYEKAAFFDYKGRIYSFSFQGSGSKNVGEIYDKVMTSAKLF